MTRLTRKEFLKLSSVGSIGILLPRKLSQIQTNINGQSIQFHGPNLVGWEMHKGNGGIGEYTIADIATTHDPSYSVVSANINFRKDISAHNDTYYKMSVNSIFDYVFTYEYKFYLPYQPVVGNLYMNGQTVEGMISLWDGLNTHLSYSVGYQWGINPTWEYGYLRCWSPLMDNPHDGRWQTVDSIPTMTVSKNEIHTVRMIIDANHETTCLQIDGHYFSSCFVIIQEPTTFGNDVTVTIKAEAISIDPGNDPYLGPQGRRHDVCVFDWSCTWDPISTARVFIPYVKK